MKKLFKSYTIAFHISSGSEITSCNVNEKGALFKTSEKPDSRFIKIENLSINYVDSISDIELQDKKFYRYPKLDLPRNKVEILKDNYNISIKRKKEDADFCIFNPDELLKNVYTTWTSYITKDELLNVIQVNKNYFVPTIYDEILKHLERVDDDGYFNVSTYAGWQWRSGSQAKHPTNIVGKVEDSIPTGIDTFYTVTGKSIDIFNDILNTQNLISDSALLEKVSQHSVIITEEDFVNLNDMIKSNNNENMTMALEVMSNCDIQKSFDKVACLLYYNIEWIKYATNWNTVNIKALRKIMNEYCNVYTATAQARYYNSLLKQLEKDYHLTQFAVDLTSKLLYKNVIHTQFGNDSIFEFKLSDVRLKPKSILNINKPKANEDCELLTILLNDR